MFANFYHVEPFLKLLMHQKLEILALNEIKCISFIVFQTHQPRLTLICGTTMILEPHKCDRSTYRFTIAKVPKRSFFLSLLQLEIVISEKKCGMCFCQTNFHQKEQYIYFYSKLLVHVFYFVDLV